MNPERPRAIVVGAGLGGIAAAARLARAGYAVTVLEKNSTPGGRCGRLTRAGHRFDVGPTLFLMPEVFEATYADLGERLADHLDLIRVDPTYQVRFDDGAALTLTSDLNALERQLEAIEPGSFGGLLRYLDEGRRHYHLALERFVGRNFYSLADYFSPANLPLLFQLKALVRHYANIGRYFRDPRLKAAFTFQNMYLGLSPYDAPATYSLLQYTELARGVWFPRGGLFRVVESLVAIAERLGVGFRYDAPVERIVIEGGRAAGVVLDDGTRLPAEVVVANADLPYVYARLLPDDGSAARLDRLAYTSSAIMFYWGVDRAVPALGTHNVFLAGGYRASFDRIFRAHDLPAAPSFYVHAPARVDPAAAPAGQDTLFVLVPVGHLDPAARQDWTALKDRARRAVLTRLAAMGVTDLQPHLKFEICYGPVEWQRHYNLAKGAAFGLSHTFRQVGYLRPRNRHARFPNLYFVGSSTHPGTGLPIVLISARLVVERILAEMGAPARTGALAGARPAVAASRS
jgi:phytoene desaturase